MTIKSEPIVNLFYALENEEWIATYGVHSVFEVWCAMIHQVSFFSQSHKVQSALVYAAENYGMEKEFCVKRALMTLEKAQRKWCSQTITERRTAMCVNNTNVLHWCRCISKRLLLFQETDASLQVRTLTVTALVAAQPLINDYKKKNSLIQSLLNLGIHASLSNDAHFLEYLEYIGSVTSFDREVEKHLKRFLYTGDRAQPAPV